ncbi:MAG: ATP-binding protein, partial [Clostridia bacterium]
MMQLLKDSEEIKSISTGEMAKILADAYGKYIEKNIPFKQFPAVMLWGAPGVGKSQGVVELAEILESNTGKKVVITDVRLILFNPVDLRGIPTSNVEKTMAIWLKPKIFEMSEDSDIVNVLFLDEITSAPQSVQAAAYQITLDRTIGEHKLPDNCFVICAGNRLNDRSVSVKMP